MRFKKGEKIKTEGKIFECFVSDEELACFGVVVEIEDGKSVDFDDTFVVSNIKGFDDGFKYEKI